MSDPHYRDPRHNPPRPDQEPPPRQIMELEKSNNAMWGWIAGAIAVLLVLIFVFAGGRTGTETASDGTAASPPATTGSAPQRTQPPAAAQSPRPAPGATTGQGGTR